MRAEQDNLAARCYHPDGGYIRFPRSALEHGVPARFEQQVCLRGDRLAVASQEGRLTYAELNCAANNIAHALLASSARSGEATARTHYARRLLYHIKEGQLGLQCYETRCLQCWPRRRRGMAGESSRP
jgi:non-ribosomal peptide synthetase component F